MSVVLRAILYSLICLTANAAIIYWTYTQSSDEWRIYVGFDVAVVLLYGIFMIVH